MVLSSGPNGATGLQGSTTGAAGSAEAPAGQGEEAVRDIAGDVQRVPALPAPPSLPRWGPACPKRASIVEERMAVIEMVAPWSYEQRMAKWCEDDLAEAAGGDSAVADAGVEGALKHMCANASRAFHLAQYRSPSNARAFCNAVDAAALGRAVAARDTRPLYTAAAKAGRRTDAYVKAVLAERPHLPVSVQRVHPKGAQCVARLVASGELRPHAELRCGVLHDGTLLTHRAVKHEAEAEERLSDLEAVRGSEQEQGEAKKQLNACHDKVAAMWRDGDPGDRVVLRQRVCDQLATVLRLLKEREDFASDALERAEAHSTDPRSVHAQQSDRYAQARLALAKARVDQAYARLALAEGRALGVGTAAMRDRRRKADRARRDVRLREDDLAAQAALRTEDEEAMELEQALEDATDPAQRLQVEEQLATLEQQRTQMLEDEDRRRSVERLVEDGERELAKQPNDARLRGRLAKAKKLLAGIPAPGSAAKAVDGDPCFSCKAHMVEVLEQARPFVGGGWDDTATYMRHYCYQYLHIKLEGSGEAAPLCDALSAGIANGTTEERYMSGFAAPLTEFCEQSGMCAATARATAVRGPETRCEHCTADMLGAVDVARTRARKKGGDAAEAATDAAQELCEDIHVKMGVAPQRSAALCEAYAHPESGAARFGRPAATNTTWRDDYRDAMGMCRAAGKCTANEVQQREEAAVTVDEETEGSAAAQAARKSSAAVDADLRRAGREHAKYVMLTRSRARAERAAASRRESLSRAQDGLARALDAAVEANATMVEVARNVTDHAAVTGAVNGLMHEKERALARVTELLKNRTNKAHELVMHRGQLKADEREAEEARASAAFDLEAMKAKEAELLDSRVKRLSEPLWQKMHEVNERVADLEARVSAGGADADNASARLEEAKKEADRIAGRIASVQSRVHSELVADEKKKRQQVTEAASRAASDRDGEEQDSSSIVSLRPKIDEASGKARLLREQVRLVEGEAKKSREAVHSGQEAMWRAVDAFIAAEARVAAAEEALLDNADRAQRSAGATGAAAPRALVRLLFDVHATGVDREAATEPTLRAHLRERLAHLLDVLATDIRLTGHGTCPTAAVAQLAKEGRAKEEPCMRLAVEARVDARHVGKLTRQLQHDWSEGGQLARALPAASDGGRGSKTVRAWVPSDPTTEALEHTPSSAERENERREEGAQSAAGKAGPGGPSPRVLPITHQECVDHVLGARESAFDKARARGADQAAARDDVDGLLRNATRDACITMATDHLLNMRVDAAARCEKLAQAVPSRTDVDDDLPVGEQVCEQLVALATKLGARPALNQGAPPADRLLPAGNADIPCPECENDNMGDREPYPSEFEVPEEAVLPSQAALENPHDGVAPASKGNGHPSISSEPDVKALTNSFIRGAHHAAEGE